MGRVSSFLSFARGAVGGNPGGAAAGGITTMGVVNAALDGTMTYASDRMENPENSTAVSAAKGALTGAAWLFAEPLMWGLTIGAGAASLGKMGYEEAKNNRAQEMSIKNHVKKDATGSNAGSIGGNFVDNEATYTMRQRQMDLLKQHKMSTESILGSEARQLHR